MVRNLIAWALASPLIIILTAVIMAVGGVYAFKNINVEAYPDPAPAIIEVVAQWPGASAEEMERQVTIPLEVALAGMPGLKATHSKSLFGLSHLRNVFHYGYSYEQARQEVLNRLQSLDKPLPDGVSKPVISPASPIGEIFRYTLKTPKDALGNDIYTLNDIKALQDWLIEREFKRVPRIIAVTSSGGTIKRYEVQPDPNRLKRFGITLGQLQSALSNSNANVAGDVLVVGRTAQMVRCVGVIGGGQDPMEKALAMDTPEEAARFLRAEDQKRLNEIRDIVITAVNGAPIRIDDVVEGGPRPYDGAPSTQGVIVSHQTRLGRVSLDKAMDDKGRDWRRDDEKIQGIILMRKGEQSLPSLAGVKEKLEELKQRGHLLPGVEIEPYYDREELVHLTTHTVTHNLGVGMILVALILVMFLSNVRSALIVAINIPLALMFAFAMLYLRGQSANLLSIGAVDFGIIVDSSVIMVENIYRYLATGVHAELPLKERIRRASHEIEKALFFSTTIMVCAFIPLFTMSGSEGQLFGPMAQTYAFALGGALLLSLTLTPVLCLLFFRHLKPTPDNFIVRSIKIGYLWLLARCLHHRAVTMAVMGAIVILTVIFPLSHLGREFMPELEEGNLWIRGTFPVHVSLEAVKDPVRQAREIMSSPAYPEIAAITVQAGRPDDGTDPGGFNNVEFFVPLRPETDWPVVQRPNGERKRRTRREIMADLDDELTAKLPGIEWSFSQYIRDNVMEALSGVKGDNCVKIYGADLVKLEELAEQTKHVLSGINGLDNLGVFRIMGQSNFTLGVDKEKCKRWGIQAADLNNVIESAVRGKDFTQTVEGEKSFAVTLRWPPAFRGDQSAILDVPVDIVNNLLTVGAMPVAAQTSTSGPATGPAASGSAQSRPAILSANLATYNSFRPRLRLGDLVSPVGPDGRPISSGSFSRPAGSIITREQGKRFIAVKFSVKEERDLASAVAEVKEKTEGLYPRGYRAAFGGEFEQMEDAEGRLLVVIPLSLMLIVMLLYFAFRSWLDVAVIFSNVLAMGIGGAWALYLTGTNFSISAAVGFISLFGVAIMDGLLVISYFNDLRAKGLPVQEAIMEGAAMRVRPVTMTDLTAILGLLPTAFSTAIGSQTQRPLAIVVVGGMLTTLFLTRYLMPVIYSFYGHREPPKEAAHLAH
jgi:heavy metal efflux system protein